MGMQFIASKYGADGREEGRREKERLKRHALMARPPP